MSRIVWARAQHLGLVVLAACGTPARTPVHVAPHVVTADAAAAPIEGSGSASTAAVVRMDGVRRRIEAPHGGAITTLAVTSDGKSAISCDELAGIRLWPTLDGKTEPRLVDLPRPRMLALATDPRGFLVALIDDVGGLVLQIIDQEGVTVQRASLPPEPAFTGVEMTSRGPLAWRTDQTLVRFAADGSITAQLAAEAGQRILEVAVAGDRAVAVIESSTDGKAVRRARWFTLGAKLAWGTWIDAGNDVGAVVALSPSGKRLASLVGGPNRGTSPTVVVLDTADGSVLANEVTPNAVSIGLVDDDHLALGSQGGIAWISLTRSKSKPKIAPDAGELADQGMLGVGGGRAIGASNGELMIATPTQLQYLGYELESPAVAAVAPKGQLLIGLGDNFAMLDAELRAVATPEIAVAAGSVVSYLHWLGGDDWLVEASKISDGSTALSLVDLAQHRSQILRTNMPMVQTLMHEPITQLVTLSLGDMPEVSRYDAKTHRIDKIASLPKPKGYEQAELVPVVPALSGGTQIVVVQMRDRMTLRWVKDPRALDKGVAITVDGSLAGVDRAGHVFVWQNTPTGPLELVIYLDAKRTGTLPSDGPTVMVPDPRGAQVVQIGQRSVALVGLDGQRKWAQALQGVNEALWLDDGALAIISPGGLARLDATTGAVIAARCGWRFGLSAKPHPVSPRVEPVCTQLRP